jgi:hypothetical protein
MDCSEYIIENPNEYPGEDTGTPEIIDLYDLMRYLYGDIDVCNN